MTNIGDSFELDQIEKRLKNIFASVEPDPGFVQRLKDKLKKKTEIYLERNEPVFYFLVVILGVIVAILAYFVAIRKKE